MPARTWFALFGPPAAWFVSLSASFFMVAWACGSSAGTITMHAVLLGMLATALWAGFTGFRSWRRSGLSWPGESADPIERERFLAVVGTFAGILFSLLILAQWIAAVVLDPCEPGPRPPMAPSALALPLLGPFS